MVITSRLQASISQARFHLGERVRSGDPLLTLDSYPLEVEALALSRTVKEMDLAGINLKRARALSEPGITLKKENDTICR